MTLTEVSFYGRKFAPFVLLVFLLILILYYLVRVLLLTFAPSSEVPTFIDPIFGSLKKPFIKDVKSSTDLKYTLDTIEGKPITSTDSARVYFLPETTTKFGYRERIYLIAKSIGFDTEVIKHRLEGKEAIFDDGSQTLKIDITNLNFTYEYKFDNDTQLFQSAIPPLKKDSEDKAKEFLGLAGRYPEELAQGKTNTIFISYNPGEKQMKLLESNKEANMAEVDFYRPDLEFYPVVAPKYFNSPNYVMLVQTLDDFKIIKAQVKFYEKSTSQIGVYPVKTGDEAWESLKSGKGFIVQNDNASDKITIKKTFIGYYDPDIYQEYLQPVYVFLGDNNFVAYVSAVTDQYFAE